MGASQAFLGPLHSGGRRQPAAGSWQPGRPGASTYALVSVLMLVLVVVAYYIIIFQLFDDDYYYH